MIALASTVDRAAELSAELPRLFALRRHVDLGGVSGIGLVAYGTLYPPTGTVTLCWLGRTTGHSSVGVYDSLDAVRTIHGHHGYTEIVWLSPRAAQPPTPDRPQHPGQHPGQPMGQPPDAGGTAGRGRRPAARRRPRSG